MLHLLHVILTRPCKLAGLIQEGFQISSLNWDDFDDPAFRHIGKLTILRLTYCRSRLIFALPSPLANLMNVLSTFLTQCKVALNQSLNNRAPAVSVVRAETLTAVWTSPPTVEKPLKLFNLQDPLHRYFMLRIAGGRLSLSPLLRHNASVFVTRWRLLTKQTWWSSTRAQTQT